MGNTTSPPLSLAIITDDTPPVSVLSATGPSLLIGATTFIAAGTTLSISATDAYAGGQFPGAGVKESFYSWDKASNGAPESGPVSAASPGLHPFFFYSVDNVGNQEAVNAATVYVDTAPPVTRLSVSEVGFNNGAHVYVSTGAIFSFSASDGGGVGVSSITVQVDGAPSAVLSFTLPLGLHTLIYHSVDVLGNIEPAQQSTFIVSNDPPSVTLSAIGTLIQAQGVNEAPESTLYALSSSELGAVIEFSQDGAPLSPYISGEFLQRRNAFPGIFGGRRIIRYLPCGGGHQRSGPDLGPVDAGLCGGRQPGFCFHGDLGVRRRAGSGGIHPDRCFFRAADRGRRHPSERRRARAIVCQRNAHGALGKSDRSGPARSFAHPGIVWKNAALPPVPLGVAFSTDTAGTMLDPGMVDPPFFFPVTLTPGSHLLTLQAANLVGNASQKTFPIVVDNQPPSTQLFLSATPFSAGGRQWISTSTVVGLISTDTLSGVNHIIYTLDGVSTQVLGSSASFTIPSGGDHVIGYGGIDNVQNAEPLRFMNVSVDAAPPQVSLVSDGPLIYRNGLYYGNGMDSYLLFGTDPAPGSGLRQINLSVEGPRPLRITSCPLHFPAKGLTP